MPNQIKRKQPDSIVQSAVNKKKKINNNKNLLKSNTNGVTNGTTTLSTKKTISLIFGTYITTKSNEAKNLNYINIIGNPNILNYLNWLKFYKEKNFLYNRNKIIPQCNLKIIKNALFYGPKGNGKETLIKKFCIENNIPLILVKNENICSESTMNAEIMKKFFQTVEILSKSKKIIIILFSKCDYLFGFKYSKSSNDKVDESVNILINKIEQYHSLNKNIFTIVTTSKYPEINASILKCYERIGLLEYPGQLLSTEYYEIWKNILTDIGINNMGFLESHAMQEVINLCSKHYTYGQISDFISKVINNKLISLNENSEIEEEDFNFSNLILRDEDFTLKIHKSHNTRRLTSYDAANWNFQNYNRN